MSDRFRPGPAHDLLRPEPHSTTGRAIASLALRRMNDALAGFDEAVLRDAHARHALVSLREALDALLPGRPKLRVGVLSSPFVRGPLSELLRGGAGDQAAFGAALSGLFALQLRGALDRPRVVWAPRLEVLGEPPLSRAAVEGETRFPLDGEGVARLAAWEAAGVQLVPDAAPAFGFTGSALSGEVRSRFDSARHLLDAAASTELSELPRFFPLLVPVSSGGFVCPGVLGLALEGSPLQVALAIVEALALEKLRLYAVLLGGDDAPLREGAARVVRLSFLATLGARRHPIATTPEFREAREALDEVAPLTLEGGVDADLEPVAAEIRRLSLSPTA